MIESGNGNMVAEGDNSRKHCDVFVSMQGSTQRVEIESSSKRCVTVHETAVQQRDVVAESDDI